MADRVVVKGLKVFGHHGVREAERERGQHFLIDIEATLDLSEAGQTDRLDRTLDYGPLVREVERLVSAQRFQLLEALAEQIAGLVLQDERVAAARVRVAKPQPPMASHLAEVAVEIERRR